VVTIITTIEEGLLLDIMMIEDTMVEDIKEWNKFHLLEYSQLYYYHM
jgi:hypothetical protein